MIVTTGMLALAGIGGTAFGAAVAPVTGWLTRLGDRKHERKQDFEKRAAEDKKKVLIGIVAMVAEMRRACETESSWRPQGVAEEIQFARMRIRGLRVYHDNRLSFVPPELLAYGSNSVCSRLQELERLLRAHYTVATTVNLNQLADLRRRSMEQDDPNEALKLYSQAQDMEDTLGTGDDLNVHDLRMLCDNVLDAAKKDLRGE